LLGLAGVEAVGDRHAPVLAEGAVGDLDAGGRLYSLRSTMRTANSMPESTPQTLPAVIIPQLVPGTKMEAPDVFISTEFNGVSLIMEKVSIILCQDIPAEIQIPVDRLGNRSGKNRKA